MQKKSMFDVLSRKMTHEQREEMLLKFKESDKKMDSNIKFVYDISTEPMSFKTIYAQMGPITKFIIMVKQFVSKLPFNKVVEDVAFSKIRNSLSSGNKAILTSGGKTANNNLINYIENLESSIGYMKWALNCVNFYGKGAFYAFLNSTIFPESSAKFESDLDPEKSLSSGAITDENFKKKDIEAVFESYFQNYPNSQKEKMYKLSQNLYKLERIVNFPYSALIRKLKNGPISATGNEFRSLTSILFGFDQQLEDILFKSIFIYAQQVDEKTKIEYPFYMEQVKKFLLNISELIKNVDLKKLTAYLMQVVGYVPQSESGGEDWFANLKSYWNSYKDKKIEECLRIIKVEKHLYALKDLFKVSNFGKLSNYNYEKWNRYDIEIYFSYSLSFINYFMENFYQNFNELIVDPLVKEGQFYKQKNKEDLLLCIKKLSDISAIITSAENTFSTIGYYWTTIEDLNSSSEDMTIQFDNLEKKIYNEQLQYNRSIDFFITDFSVLSKILYGILYGEFGGTYDTLSNLKKFKNVDNQHFFMDLKNSYEKISGFEFIINDVYTLEKNEFLKKGKR